ncbi:Acyl-CoA N-acyltransferase, partial [Penicillium sp. DV-2018c]
MAVKSIPITHGGEKRLDAVAQLNGRVFDTDPVIAYMLLELSPQERRAYLPTYWYTLVKSAVLNQAVITEVDGWKAASVLLPPGRSVDNVVTLLRAGFLGVLWRIGIPGLKRLWCEFSGMTDNAKKKGLRGQRLYYYVFSLGTEREHRGKGEIVTYFHLASSVDFITPTGYAKVIMREHQQTAQAANLPIWLEATTSSSRSLYLSLGFQEVEKIVLGKGKVATDASLQPGGPGVPMWAM